jgi:hypothetical protein
VTQHGSFPGRPRGRRARHEADLPEGDGYAATPPEEREFPDLPPIRPSHARARDAGGQDDWQGRRAEPGQYEPQGRGGQPGPGGYGAGYPAAGPGYGQSGYDQQAGPGYRPQPGAGQAPWADQDWPNQDRPNQDRLNQDWQPQAPTRQSAQQPGPATAQPPQIPPPQSDAARPQSQQRPAEEDVPSWAEPDSVEAFSARWHRRGLDSRDDRRTDRRKRRRTLVAIGSALAVVIALAVYHFGFDDSNSSANLGFGSLVTQFLPGEVQSVPDACTTVPSATLSQFLPGTTKQAAPPLNSGTNTECSWTLDNPPTYRVLEVQIEAYTPSALVANPDGSGLVPAGNGSATYAAEAAMASSEYTLETPAANSGQAKAVISTLSGMPGGNDTSAFSATQVLNKNGETFDVATVYVRYRNVIVTAVVQGLNQTTGAKKYGPVSMSDLTTAATSVAHEVTAKIV